jgi:NAD(P)-dependent dehydrogenase (short-subunit alcohol dehydrogenase family)
MKTKKLAGRWALVTGASRGIGTEIAKGLAELGCNIYVHARTEEHARPVAATCARLGVEAVQIAAELSSQEEIARLVETVMKKTKGVDILYNNAAVMSQWGNVFETPLAEWRRVFAINVEAVILLCGAFAPGMRERGFGRIINLTSGIKDTPNLTPYSVSKAAIDKYSRDIACELKGANVLVNYLDPGWLKTDLGGKDAWFEVDTVVPGALVPALLEDNGPTGEFYYAQAFKYLKD